MSYVHYWEWDNSIADRQHFADWSADVALLIHRLPAHRYNGQDPLVIRGFDGSGEPLCTETEVSFNGDCTSGQDFGHEGFRIVIDDLQQQDFFNYCKTAVNPYDLLATAALLRFVHHFPDAIITSDGNAQAWKEPSLLCERVFGPHGGNISLSILNPGLFE